MFNGLELIIVTRYGEHDETQITNEGRYTLRALAEQIKGKVPPSSQIGLMGGQKGCNMDSTQILADAFGLSQPFSSHELTVFPDKRSDPRKAAHQLLETSQGHDVVIAVLPDEYANSMINILRQNLNMEPLPYCGLRRGEAAILKVSDGSVEYIRRQL